MKQWGLMIVAVAVVIIGGWFLWIPQTKGQGRPSGIVRYATITVDLRGKQPKYILRRPKGQNAIVEASSWADLYFKIGGREVAREKVAPVHVFNQLGHKRWMLCNVNTVGQVTTYYFHR